MRFVHVADVHLDTSFSGRSEPVRRRLREASREAFGRAVDLAIREDVHALLVAGDLFDGERLSFATERFLLEETSRLGEHGITVVYATGNHDPGSTATGARRLSWPANVHVASDATPQRIEITDDAGEPVGHVIAAGHEEDGETRDLSRLFPRPTGSLPAIGLLHTQVHACLGADEHHAYAPSDLSYLLRSGYDYWALGHVHVRQALADDPPVWYPGSLQGRTHADRGEHGALVVDVGDRDAPAVAFRPLAPVRWETVAVDALDEVATLDDLERRIQLAWARERESDPGLSGTEWMVRVALSGACPLWSELRRQEDREHLESELTSLLGALEVTLQADLVHPVLDLGEYRSRVDVLGEALRLTDAVRRGTATLRGLEAGDLAGAVSDDPRALHAYVRGLATDLDGELAALLLDDAAG